jgi:hypothetical protein
MLATPGRRLDVADTRVGVDAVHIPHLLDRFYRVDASRSRRRADADSDSPSFISASTLAPARSP